MSTPPAKQHPPASEGYEQIRQVCEWWLATLAEKDAAKSSDADAGEAAEPVDATTVDDLLHPKTPRAMRDLCDLLFKGLVSRMSEGERSKAAVLAVGLLNDIRERFANESLYISSGHFEFASAIAKEVLAEFNGLNKLEVARKHGISPRRVQQIAAQAQREKVARAKAKVWPPASG